MDNNSSLLLDETSTSTSTMAMAITTEIDPHRTVSRALSRHLALRDRLRQGCSDPVEWDYYTINMFNANMMKPQPLSAPFNKENQCFVMNGGGNRIPILLRHSTTTAEPEEEAIRCLNCTDPILWNEMIVRMLYNDYIGPIDIQWATQFCNFDTYAKFFTRERLKCYVDFQQMVERYSQWFITANNSYDNNKYKIMHKNTSRRPLHVMHWKHLLVYDDRDANDDEDGDEKDHLFRGFAKHLNIDDDDEHDDENDDDDDDDDERNRLLSRKHLSQTSKCALVEGRLQLIQAHQEGK